MRTFLVTADYNDADYVSGITTITDEEFERFLPVIEAIQNFKPYLDAFGPNYSNWDSIRYDLGGMKPEELYPQFDEKLLEEFQEKFLSLHYPDYECGFHSIINIQEITLGKRYVYGAYEDLKDRSLDMITEWNDKRKEYREYRRTDGKGLGSIPFKELTEEEIRIMEMDNNLWLDYRKDLDRDKWYRKVTNKGYDFNWKLKEKEGE